MDTCPKCGKALNCLAGCSAHGNNWFCSDEAGCGWQAWKREAVMKDLPSGDTEKMRRKWKMVDADCREGSDDLITYHVNAFNEGWQAAIASKQAELDRLYNVIIDKQAELESWQIVAEKWRVDAVDWSRKNAGLVAEGTNFKTALKTAQELINAKNAKVAALKTKIAEADKREPFGYWHRGESIEESDFLLFADMPNSDEDCEGCIPLFTRLPITSQRELELLAVIEQMREAIYASIHCDYQGNYKGRHHVEQCQEALALTPDLSALKEHGAQVLEDAAKWFFEHIDRSDGFQISEELRRMADELRNNHG